MSEDRKEWVRVSRDAKGARVVSVTVQEENLVAKWAVKAVGLKQPIQTAVKEARAGALADLAALREALDG
jgi:hypothetical protein